MLGSSGPVDGEKAELLGSSGPVDREKAELLETRNLRACGVHGSGNSLPHRPQTESWKRQLPRNNGDKAKTTQKLPMRDFTLQPKDQSEKQPGRTVNFKLTVLH